MESIFEGEKFDRFKEHIMRNKYRYLAGAVGVAAGKRFLHNYAENPEGIKQAAREFGVAFKNLASDVGKKVKTDVQGTVKDVKTIATR